MKEPLSVVRYPGGATVHRMTCTSHSTAEHAPNTLVPQADAEEWDAT